MNDCLRDLTCVSRTARLQNACRFSFEFSQEKVVEEKEEIECNGKDHSICEPDVKCRNLVKWENNATLRRNGCTPSSESNELSIMTSENFSK